MSNQTTVGVKLDNHTRERLKEAAVKINRTSHWLIKQSIFHYLHLLEQGKSVEDIALLESGELESVDEVLSNAPFLQFAQSILPQGFLRSSITSAYRRPEHEMVSMLLESARFSPKDNQAVFDLSKSLVDKLRTQKKTIGKAGIVQDLLQEYALSSQEGIALMCMAEALLRIPDKATRDALIRDKIGKGDWKAHLGGGSMFVNAATWGLMLTGKLVATHSEKNLSKSLNGILAKSGSPLIRKSVDMAMRLMGEQFVCGENIAEALANAQSMEEKGFLYSYDMLGEAALTEEDAQDYLQSYRQAILAIGKASNGRGIYQGPGISIKLSALHPRYTRAQYDRVMDELYPRVLELMQMAKEQNIGVNIDAEEANRLELSLDLLERLCYEPSLAGWNGIGFVIQAYQKRCPFVIDYLVDLAKRTNHRLMVRLVKGAYWDSEIKMSQIEGLEDYPVYTRKVHTDISYVACARKMLAAQNEIYPQFASHNARTLASIYQMAGRQHVEGQYEFQCLHGMGEPLYQYVVGSGQGQLGVPCRVYAPVGTHETLLAYLVRRLLENGANTSFVNLIADPNNAAEDLVIDPVVVVEKAADATGVVGLHHDKIVLPHDLYGKERINSFGFDFSNEHRLASLSAALLHSSQEPWLSLPILDTIAPEGETYPVLNPANQFDVVGHSRFATLDEAKKALDIAQNVAPIWQAATPAERAAVLEAAADLMQERTEVLIGLLVREAGKTFANAIAEVREAIDFLRFYASQAKTIFQNDTHRPLGIVVCISPWNFPLAIFIGQVCAALAAGNVAIAKPAEQTPLIAAEAIRLLLEAGLTAGVVQLLPGEGHIVGDALVKDSRVKGVMFTGSTEVARLLSQNIAGRLDDHGQPIPLIAETGGQNVMVVDSSALTEQVVVDVINSAFDSAGQRCSALRVLCVQEECADRVVRMLKGAIAEYRLGSPDDFAVDIGPVIDAEAKNNIENHITQMREAGHAITQLYHDDRFDNNKGFFVAPTIIEIDDISELKREVFGPVLHIVRYRRENLPRLIDDINATGYGLTMGVHTRIDETTEAIIARGHAGNMYVNRNMVGAVVGVQPFGGEGLSGTGPKAGGPLYLHRLLSTYPQDSVARSIALLNEPALTEQLAQLKENKSTAMVDFEKWLQAENKSTLLKQLQENGSLVGLNILLPGPTGEDNIYHLNVRENVLCLADDENDLLAQLLAIIAGNTKATWVKNTMSEKLYASLPNSIQKHIQLVDDYMNTDITIDSVLFHGDADQLQQVSIELSQGEGAIIGIAAMNRGEVVVPALRLLVERSISINTAAAGGNANLMMIG